MTKGRTPLQLPDHCARVFVVAFPLHKLAMLANPWMSEAVVPTSKMISNAVALALSLRTSILAELNLPALVVGTLIDGHRRDSVCRGSSTGWDTGIVCVDSKTSRRKRKKRESLFVWPDPHPTDRLEPLSNT